MIPGSREAARAEERARNREADEYWNNEPEPEEPEEEAEEPEDGDAGSDGAQRK